MNKQGLINAVAADSGLTKQQAADAVSAIFDAEKGAIANCLAAGDELKLIGFGTFSIQHREARQGRNPQNGQPMQIRASNSPKFKAGSSLKSSVN